MADTVIVLGSTATGLRSATATGPGETIAFQQPRRNLTLQTVVTGAPTAVSVTLEGSLNGTNWFVLATSTSTTGDAQFSADKPVSFVRANLGTLTGGTAPTVSAFIAAV